MAKYRKKPVVIEAYHVESSEFCINGDLPEWLTDALINTGIGNVGSVWLDINGDWTVGTLENPMKVSIGDWIIRGVQGELYPCKPDIFEQTYEAV